METASYCPSRSKIFSNILPGQSSRSINFFFSKLAWYHQVSILRPSFYFTALLFSSSLLLLLLLCFHYYHVIIVVDIITINNNNTWQHHTTDVVVVSICVHCRAVFPLLCVYSIVSLVPKLSITIFMKEFCLREFIIVKLFRLQVVVRIEITLHLKCSTVVAEGWRLINTLIRNWLDLQPT